MKESREEGPFLVIGDDVSIDLGCVSNEWSQMLGKLIDISGLNYLSAKRLSMSNMPYLVCIEDIYGGLGS